MKNVIEKLSIIDALIIGYSIFQILYTGLLGHNLENQGHVILVYAGCLLAAMVSITLKLKINYLPLRILGNFYPIFLLAIFYEIAGHQVHMFFDGFFDDFIINAENSFFGIHPTIWFEKFHTTWLTEWMMFGYSFYLPLIPILITWLYYSHKNNDWQHMMGSLLISFFTCYIIFTLFPVTGPRIAMADQFTGALDGYFFRSFTRLLESDAMLHGGAFPSAHCAAATVMFIISYRYNRRMFYLAAPVLITLIISTIYGRYHYPVDAIAGILIGIAGVYLFKPLNRRWNCLVNPINEDTRKLEVIKKSEFTMLPRDLP